MRRNKQTQGHEKKCRFVVSKFLKLSDELIIRQFNYNGLGKNVLLKIEFHCIFLDCASASPAAQPHKIRHLLRSLWG